MRIAPNQLYTFRLTLRWGIFEFISAPAFSLSSPRAARAVERLRADLVLLSLSGLRAAGACIASGIGTGLANSTGSIDVDSCEDSVSCDWVGANGSTGGCDEAGATYSESVELPGRASLSGVRAGSPRSLGDGPADRDGDVGDVGDVEADLYGSSLSSAPRFSILVGAMRKLGAYSLFSACDWRYLLSRASLGAVVCQEAGTFHVLLRGVEPVAISSRMLARNVSLDCRRSERCDCASVA